MKLRFSLMAAIGLLSTFLSATVQNVSVTSNAFTPNTVGDTMLRTINGGSHNVNGTAPASPGIISSFNNAVSIETKAFRCAALTETG
ncbi:MAG: hypothetical protein U5L96_19380 [Owenweeksia sp.]|nr:hypothetical protein [Owenweeksia sp.]